MQRSKQLGHSDATYAALEEKRRTQAPRSARDGGWYGHLGEYDDWRGGPSMVSKTHR